MQILWRLQQHAEGFNTYLMDQNLGEFIYLDKLLQTIKSARGCHEKQG